jgi:phosphoribosylformimino-5-aminoimidazole carboxamide ribonucleotide (ProFAR) isomerase
MKKLTRINILEYINNLKEICVQEILYRGILSDEMLTGQDYEGSRKFPSDNSMRIVVAGSVLLRKNLNLKMRLRR